MTEQEASRLKKIYPWYKPAAIFLSALKGETDESLTLHFMLFPKQQIKDVSPDDFRKYENSLAINDFLACKNIHIVPAEQVPEGDLSISAAEDDELVSEELAEIYLSQGHKELARKTYEKLSLLNPEKSVYFAELIEKTGKPENE